MALPVIEFVLLNLNSVVLIFQVQSKTHCSSFSPRRVFVEHEVRTQQCCGPVTCWYGQLMHHRLWVRLIKILAIYK